MKTILNRSKSYGACRYPQESTTFQSCSYNDCTINSFMNAITGNIELNHSFEGISEKKATIN
jgi:hypothetical protein